MLAVDKLLKDLAVKDNEQAQTRLTLEKSLAGSRRANAGAKLDSTPAAPSRGREAVSSCSRKA